MKKGLLLINLGTPTTPDVAGVRRYLREFLSDSRVIDLPAPLKYLLLYVFILPFRPKISSKAYQSIWTENGSPLMVNSLRLVDKLSARIGESYQVALGMRYGEPSIDEALQTLSNCQEITVLPLYPQYSSAATGSSIEKLLTLIAPKPSHPSLKIIRDFYQHPGFIEAQADLIRPFLSEHDYLLFSYHGIPERHLHRTGCQPVCLDKCPPINSSNQACYKAQCQQTTTAIAKALNLSCENYGLSFQSRLGKTPWIKPYTDFALPLLAQQGVKRLAIACPSFVADCLETLEEIGLRAQKQWLDLGGEKLTLIPCVNHTDKWVEGLLDICEINGKF